MQQIFIEYIYLILIILALVMLAQRLKISYPIILVVGGLVLSFTTPFYHITIDPELIFFIFLPPLLYEAAWATSWKELWKWRRIIMSFAFPIVIVTSCTVAFVSVALIPGFTLALGFLLGGIVSPPDAISATSIMRNVNAPRNLVSIVEGESLLNDASSLVVYRFAIAAVITGQFVFHEALGQFFLVIVLGALIGVAIGLIFYAIHRWLPTTPAIDIVLSFITPYAMYYFAELFHFSGVLAVVSGGLLLSSKRQKMLTYLSRIQGANVWSTVGFVLNGLIFMLIGLQLPSIVNQLEDTSLKAAIGYGVLITLVLIITRLICTFCAGQFTRFISRYITVAESNPGWRGPIVFGWAGMRGVVSLAAALAIPRLLEDGSSFPQRNVILFITFLVILFTLVFQGLTLPWVIRKFRPEDRTASIPQTKQETIILKKLTQASLNFLQKNYSDKIHLNEHMEHMQLRLNTELRHFTKALDSEMTKEENPLVQHQLISLQILEEQRQLLYNMNHKMEFDEEIIRKYLALLDLEETKLREKLPEGMI